MRIEAAATTTTIEILTTGWKRRRSFRCLHTNSNTCFHQSESEKQVFFYRFLSVSRFFDNRWAFYKSLINKLSS